MSKQSVSTANSSSTTITSDNVTTTATDSTVSGVRQTQVPIPVSEEQPFNSCGLCGHSIQKAAKIGAILDMVNETLRVIGFLLYCVWKDQFVTLDWSFLLTIYTLIQLKSDPLLNLYLLLSESIKLAASIRLLNGVLKKKPNPISCWLVVFGIDLFLFTAAFALSFATRRSVSERYRAFRDRYDNGYPYHDEYPNPDPNPSKEIYEDDINKLIRLSKRDRLKSRERFLESDYSVLKLCTYVLIQLLRMYGAWIYTLFMKTLPKETYPVQTTPATELAQPFVPMPMVQRTEFAQPGGMMPMMPMGNNSYPITAHNFNQREAPPPRYSGNSCHPCGACDTPIDNAAQIFSYIDLTIQIFLTIMMLIIVVYKRAIVGGAGYFVILGYVLVTEGLGGMYFVLEFLKLGGSIGLVIGVRKFHGNDGLVYMWLIIMSIDGLMFLISILKRGWGMVHLNVLIYIFRLYGIWVNNSYVSWLKSGSTAAGTMQMGNVQYPTPYQPVSLYPGQSQVYPYAPPYPPAYPAPYPGQSVTIPK